MNKAKLIANKIGAVETVNKYSTNISFKTYNNQVVSAWLHCFFAAFGVLVASIFLIFVNLLWYK